ncbi:MAG: hypothetical protein LBK75_08385 [Oscillospiraceae bacterium]|jgi:hypothetical protein|nr:hypothetical protein [Oscillospiraceae bacterium]
MYYLVEGYRHPEDPFVQEVLKMNEGLRTFAEQYHFNASDPKVQQKYFDYQMALWAERDRRETAVAISDANWRVIVADKDAALVDKDAEIARLRALLGKTKQ